MIRTRKSLKSAQYSDEINMAPLIDLVFLLLIFFMVTTSFVREAGVDVQRPMAETAEIREKGAIFIAIDDNRQIFMNKKQIDIRMVRAYVEKELAENPEGETVIIADRDSHTGVVIDVMDQCRLAGSSDVSIAAKRPEGR